MKPLFFVYNYINNPQHHWLKCSPKPWQSLQCVLQMAKDKFWIHHSVRPVAVQFFWILAFFCPFSLFLFLKTGFLTATLPLKPLLMRAWFRVADQLTSQMHLSGRVSDLYLSYSLMNISSAVDSFFRPATSFSSLTCPVSLLRTHCASRYTNSSANSSLETTLVHALSLVPFNACLYYSEQNAKKLCTSFS